MDTHHLELGLEVLDHQVLDDQGNLVGKVDDIELEGVAGGEAVVTTILMGTGAWLGRLPRWSRPAARLVLPRAPRRVPWKALEREGASWRIRHPDRRAPTDSERTAFSTLLGAPVVADGHRLGRCFEVRAEDSDNASVLGVLVGGRAFLHRLGFRRGGAHAAFIAWADVVAVSERVIEVRAGVRPGRDP
jgi:sporulation protein YlmC with PRC-barrel domain